MLLAGVGFNIKLLLNITKGSKMNTMALETRELREESNQISDIQIEIGCLISLVDMESGEYGEYMLVSSNNPDNVFSEITSGSPVGKALLGHRIGDIINTIAPSGNIKYKVINVQTVI